MRLQESLIVANLTKSEYRRFERAHIMYSGATGMGADPASYNGYGPYIATYFDQLQKVLRLFRWKHCEIIANGGQFIVRRMRKESR